MEALNHATNNGNESELHFRQLADTLPLVIWTASPDGNLTFISKQWEAVYGNPVKESLGTGWADYVHPADVEKAGEIWAASLKSGKKYETEFRVKHKSGEYHWILVRAMPVQNNKGEIIAWNGSNTDIHEKKLNEYAFKESEKKFRTLADNIPNLAWMADADGFIYWYNKKWYEYTGTKPKEMEGWGWQSVHDPQTLPAVLTRWKSSIATGEPFDMVFPLKGADGKFRQFLTRVEPLRDEQGKIYQWFGTNTDVTKQIETEQSLKESEERFRTIAEGTDILIAISDETGKATYFNTAWLGLTGRTADTLLNFGWENLLHEDDRQDFIDLYLDALNKKENWKSECRVRNKEGGYSYLISKGIKLTRPDGSFAGYINSSLDISERKKSEDELVKSEQQVRSIVDSAPFPIGVYIGKEMRIEMANKSIMDTWGKGYDVVGKLYSDVLPELENQQIFAQLDQVYTTGIPFHAKNQRVDLSVKGSLQSFYFNYSFTPLFDSDEKVYGVMNTAADTTDLNLAKQKLQDSEKNLRNTILQAPVAMAILREPNFILEIANARMYEIWGKSEKELSGKPIFEGLPEAKDQGFEKTLENVYNTGESFSAWGVPVSLPRDNRLEQIYVNLLYEPYREANGTITGIIVAAIEVTEQILAKQKIEEVVSERTKELADANQNLQKSNAELAQFAYIASHDLQEPLRKITTFSQMLQERLENNTDELITKYIGKINNSTGRMNSLIRDILAYSELESKEPKYIQTDLNEIIKNTLVDFDLLIEQKQASVTKDTLPVINAIPLQMSQLFFNIIGNALKFARTDVKPVIRIQVMKISAEQARGLLLDPAREYCQLRISDNGIGIKKDYQDQIFNIFQRLHRKSEFEGTGIGLAMCKKIVLNHHGIMNAEGSSEAGAVFNIFLPLI